MKLFAAFIDLLLSLCVFFLIFKWIKVVFKTPNKPKVNRSILRMIVFIFTKITFSSTQWSLLAYQHYDQKGIHFTDSTIDHCFTASHNQYERGSPQWLPNVFPIHAYYFHRKNADNRVISVDLHNDASKLICNCCDDFG